MTQRNYFTWSPYVSKNFLTPYLCMMDGIREAISLDNVPIGCPDAYR